MDKSSIPTIEFDGRTAFIRMSSPETLNGIDEHNLLVMPQLIQRAEERAEVCYLVIQGDSNTFCSGGEVGFLEQLALMTHQERLAKLEAGQAWVSALRNSPCLTVAAIEGLAVGAGVDFALAFDVQLMGPQARIGFFYDRLAAVPDLGGLWILAQEIGFSRALSFYSSGEVWTAECAQKNGVGTLVPDLPTQGVSQWDNFLRRKYPIQRHAFSAAKRSLNLVNEDVFIAHQSAVREAQSQIFGGDDFQRRLKRVASIQRTRVARMKETITEN